MSRHRDVSFISTLVFMFLIQFLKMLLPHFFNYIIFNKNVSILNFHAFNILLNHCSSFLLSIWFIYFSLSLSLHCIKFFLCKLSDALPVVSLAVLFFLFLTIYMLQFFHFYLFVILQNVFVFPSLFSKQFCLTTNLPSIATTF